MSYHNATATRDRINWLHRQGFTYANIAAATGLTREGIRIIATGTTQRVEDYTAEQVANLNPATLIRHLPDDAHVHGIGARRRLQALHAMGWRYDDFTATHSNIGRGLFRPERTTIRVRTHRKIAELYDQLSMKPGPSQITRKRALAAGWAPPLAWDDDSIDDPNGRPATSNMPPAGIDHIAISETLAGRWHPLTAPERIEAVRHATATGHSDRQTAQLLRIQPRSVERIRAQHHIPAATTWKGNTAA